MSVFFSTAKTHNVDMPSNAIVAEAGRWQKCVEVFLAGHFGKLDTMTLRTGTIVPRKTNFNATEYVSKKHQVMATCEDNPRSFLIAIEFLVVSVPEKYKCVRVRVFVSSGAVYRRIWMGK